MPDFDRRLYVILHPTTALIGSQLTPERLARHFTVGPTRHYRGKVVFADVDPSFRHPYFQIDAAVDRLVPHEDGRPKATKYISSYRVLEHLDPASLGRLYLTSPDGALLALEQAPYQDGANEQELKVYVEIAPLRMMVLSRFGFSEFGRFITDSANAIGAPHFLYTQLDLRVDEFLGDFEQNPFMTPPIPNVHPSILRDAIKELRTVTYKNNKGLSLQSNMDNISYKMIGKGFMFASQEQRRFYPMPDSREIEQRSLKFWRNM